MKKWLNHAENCDFRYNKSMVGYNKFMVGYNKSMVRYNKSMVERLAITDLWFAITSFCGML